MLIYSHLILFLLTTIFYTSFVQAQPQNIKEWDFAPGFYGNPNFAIRVFSEERSAFLLWAAFQGTDAKYASFTVRVPNFKCDKDLASETRIQSKQKLLINNKVFPIDMVCSEKYMSLYNHNSHKSKPMDLVEELLLNNKTVNMKFGNYRWRFTSRGYTDLREAIAKLLDNKQKLERTEVKIAGISGFIERWSKLSDHDDRGVIMSPTKEAFIQLIENHAGKHIYLHQIDYTCSSRIHNRSVESPSLIVNSTKVRALEFCSSDTLKTITPYTSRGHNFIIKAFRKLSEVNIKHAGTNRTFSAIDFVRISRLLESPTGGI
ncbi:hypothetical protein [Neptuniibacter sp. QD48_11]|uniref:hypothetical protein n=1 Tax=Neptuniibacter sp. QD48_11 TaxID=3398211 RepID=UPI0039F589BF